jgi:glycosyltransferase involved in cell wall biosynthesis
MNNLPKQPGLLLVGNFLSGKGKNPSVSEDLSIRLREREWRVTTTSAQPGRLARLMDTLATIWYKRREYEIANVEVYSGLAFYLAESACWMLRRAGKPYILTLHGGNLPDFSKRWSRRVTKLLNSAWCVTAPSRYLQETMRKYRSDIRLIPNPITVSNYEFRRRKQPQPRLVWLRAFNEVYNPQLAIESLALLVKQFPHIHLTMIGPDKGDGSWQRTRELANSLGVNHLVEFPGGISKSEVNTWMNRSDIFINTTNADNTPISVLEAWACGLCVVSTNVGGLPYLVTDRQNALLVPPNNAAAMADAVSQILNDVKLAGALSQAGRTEVETFDWARVLPQWESLFAESVLAQPV